jgi:hypothetical protein
MTEATQPTIPDLVTATHGFRHNLDSALDSLEAAGIAPDRITIKLSIGGRPGYVVDAQARNAQGVPRSLKNDGSDQLYPDEDIVLTVQGSGFFVALPMGMWDRGTDGDPGTQEMVEPFDDALQKAAHWLRAGARLFDIRPENPLACERWIELFGLKPDEWPQEMWYSLALLLPSFSRLAGTEAGIRYALRLMLDLPLLEIRKRPTFSEIATRIDVHERTLLGERSSRLGVDAIVGDRLEDLAELVFVLGPLTLETYYKFQEAANRRILSSVFNLCVPSSRPYTWSWLVFDPQCAPKLGDEKQNARLGINSHLGARRPGREPVKGRTDGDDGHGARVPMQKVTVGENQ